MNKTCNACFEHKPLTDFYCSYKKNGRVYYRGECKRCKSEANQQKEALGKAMKNPHDFLECDNCDKVFFKYTERCYRTKVKTKCPYCSDFNIIQFENIEN